MTNVEKAWQDNPLPRLRLTAAEFNALPEYSASLPTGTTPGKRWKRLDGAFDRDFVRRGGKPRWMIGEYDPTYAGGKTITINWYRPVVIVPVWEITDAEEYRAYIRAQSV